MTSFKTVVVAFGLVFTLGFINASAIPAAAAAENDEGLTAEESQSLLLIAQSLMDSKMTAPPSCNCEGTVCSCCKTIKIFRWSKDVCVEVQYKKEDSSFEIKLKFGTKVIFSGTKNASEPEPLCLKTRYLPGLKLCVNVNDYKSEEGQTRGCPSISAKLLVKTVTYKMGCFDMKPGRRNTHSAFAFYYPGPAGEETNEVEPPIGWRIKTKENVPLPEDDYLMMVAYDDE